MQNIILYCQHWTFRKQKGGERETNKFKYDTIMLSERYLISQNQILWLI